MRALAALAVAALPSACAANSYMGIALDEPPATAEQAEVQALAVRARVGDRRAQLELGERYEEGRGLPVNLKRARQLYLQAATATGGTTFVYVPATTRGGRGYVMPVDTGPTIEGLEEARVRLAALQDSEDRDASPDEPSIATIEAAYLRWVNWTCARLIDQCTDDELVFADMFRAENPECQVRSADAVCTFDIRTRSRRDRCRGRFVREQRGQDSFWAVKSKDVKPRTFEPDIECNQD